MKSFFILLAFVSPFIGGFVRVHHPVIGRVLIVGGPCLLFLFIALSILKQNAEKGKNQDPAEEEYYRVANDFLRYEEGGAKAYFDKYPEEACKVFQSSIRLLELMEQRNEIPMLEELYWVGMMYEEGFGCQPDLKKAASYYEAALSADTCFKGELEERRDEVAKRLAALQQKWGKRG